MAFEVSEILEIAWGILQYTIDRVFLICLIVFFGILVAGLADVLGKLLNNFFHKLRFGKKVRRKID
jgi:hypothetical protein